MAKLDYWEQQYSEKQTQYHKLSLLVSFMVGCPSMAVLAQSVLLASFDDPCRAINGAVVSCQRPNKLQIVVI